KLRTLRSFAVVAAQDHIGTIRSQTSMDVRQLEMFRAVVEEGTFTRAAERLHVSQSAISRQLQLLEQELKTLLLHRTGPGVMLTPDGEVLLSTANRVESEMQGAVAQISG